MEVLMKNEIDFGRLKRMKCDVNSESILYHDNNTIYKMFKNLPYRDLKRKKRKIELLSSGNPLDNVVLPQYEIMDGTVLSGYTMEYIKKSFPLFDFTIKNKNINNFLQLVRKISLSLRKIHDDPRNIIVGDLSFSNIIFDENFKYYFVDFDSCMIDGISSDRICFLLDFYIKRRNINKFSISERTDKLSLMLCTLYTIFLRYIDGVSIYEYDLLSEKLETLKNMREYFLNIKKCSGSIPDVPYMDEMIEQPIKKIKGIIRNK